MIPARGVGAHGGAPHRGQDAGVLAAVFPVVHGLALDDHGARRQVHFFAAVQLHPQFAGEADRVVNGIGNVPALGDARIVLGKTEY